MKKSKRAKAAKLKDDIDRISNLSDDILHLIFSGLPTTEEVVRTSILSTRWRYLWTSFSYPSLDIDFSRTMKAPSGFEMKKFKVFMSRVLVNESLDLDSFRLCCSNYYNMRTVGRWIDAAITRNVKLLHLMISHMKEFKVPDCLVSNDSLEVLRLFLSGSSLILPNFTGLQALRVLELNSIELDDYRHYPLVKEFLKSCPLLEDLSLIDCRLTTITHLCISCPKLKSLRIDNRELDQGMTGIVEICCPNLLYWEVAGYIYHVFIIENVDSLEKAVFHPELLRMRKNVVLAKISDPGTFSFGIDFKSNYHNDKWPEEPDAAEVPLLGPNTLELTTTIDFFSKDAVFNLLIGLPLETVHLIIIQGPFWPIFNLSLSEDRMLALTEHLKTVEFVDFHGKKEELFVVCLLLEHGDVLEEMVFSWVNEAMYHEKSMEIMNEVSNFHKASSTVKLIALLKN